MPLAERPLLSHAKVIKQTTCRKARLAKGQCSGLMPNVLAYIGMNMCERGAHVHKGRITRIKTYLALT